MRIYKKILGFLLFPNGAAFLFLVPLSGALLGYAFTAEEVHQGIEYTSYILSAYTLTAVCCKLPGVLRGLKKYLGKNRYVAKYQQDTAWRMTVSLYGSVAINVSYTVLQLGLGIIHSTVWYYSMAAYTFASFTMAVINMIRYRKYQSPVLSAAKAIGFTAAMVSMLTLETTMLTVFGEGEKGDFDRIMTGSTGAAVTLTVLIMAVYMIVKSTKELKAKK